jgi:hypothetical protein
VPPISFVKYAISILLNFELLIYLLFRTACVLCSNVFLL